MAELLSSAMNTYQNRTGGVNNISTTWWLSICSINSRQNEFFLNMRTPMNIFLSLNNKTQKKLMKKNRLRVWFAPVIEGLLYVEDFTTNWFLRTWPYMEFICTCSSIVNWKIKLIWQRRLLHMSISVEATGKILYLQFVFHMRLVSFEVRSVVTLLKCKLRNELLGF